MYEVCDLLCLQSKNMYNLCNYTIRQTFIKDGVVRKYGDLNKELKYGNTGFFVMCQLTIIYIDAGRKAINADAVKL